MLFGNLEFLDCKIEGRVFSNLDAAIATLGAICRQDPALLPQRRSLEAFFSGDRLLNLHSEAVNILDDVLTPMEAH